jgi:glycosyltransferase involved in cell wall biosynthesis
MRQVIIDGIEYQPAQSIYRARVGIAVTTHNRHGVLAETLAAIEKYTPEEFPVIVVDDGSAEPATVPTSPADQFSAVRHQTAQGIPAAKNRCIDELMQRGVQHLFLFDDDTRPDAEDWWKPYVEGAEPHYQYCWTHFKTSAAPHQRGQQATRAVPKMSVVYEDSKLRAYGWSMGCMLYVTADVVRRVGGMFPDFGKGMEEHAEWSQRIHNAGLTSFVHQDVQGSGPLFYASDEHGTVSRSFKWGDRNDLLARNEKLRLARIHSTEFVDYRTRKNVVVTSFFTGHNDPQRPASPLQADWKLLQPLMASIGDTELHVLHNCFDSDINRVDAPLCAYRQRWLSEYQWLRDHPEVGYAFLVDATDVIMLNAPFEHMQPDTLYCGWEPKPVGNDWIRNHSQKVLDWVDANRQRALLNCGVVGGDRETLMRLCQKMNDLWIEHDADPLHEMAFFNIAAYQLPHNLIAGPQVTTVFKANTKSDAHAWWAHK